MKKVAQIRYYGNGNEKNFPSGLTQESFNTKLAEFKNIIQVGIQSFPGAIFYLNDSIDPILIGSTGIYELDVGNLIDINKLQINKKQTLGLINSSSGSLYVIIDILYEEVNE